VLVVGEPEGDHLPLLACNDTRRDFSGSFSVKKADDGPKIMAGEYHSPANETVQIASLKVSGDPSMLLVEWEDDDGGARNHYLVGTPPFDFKALRTWYEELLRRTV
jgi:hypothetical protein